MDQLSQNINLQQRKQRRGIGARLKLINNIDHNVTLKYDTQPSRIDF